MSDGLVKPHRSQRCFSITSIITLSGNVNLVGFLAFVSFYCLIMSNNIFLLFYRELFSSLCSFSSYKRALWTKRCLYQDKATVFMSAQWRMEFDPWRNNAPSLPSKLTTFCGGYWISPGKRCPPVNEEMAPTFLRWNEIEDWEYFFWHKRNNSKKELRQLHPLTPLLLNTAQKHPKRWAV